MAISSPHLPHLSMISHPFKRRRTATAVMAGLFDPRPARFVLTSVLNGVPPYKEVEGDVVEDDEEKAKRRQERKEQKRADKKLAKQMLRAKEKELRAAQQLNEGPDTPIASGSMSVFPVSAPAAGSSSESMSSQWRTIARPTIHIPAQPSASVTPSPTSSPRRMPSTPGTTPGPSISSSTSRTSSKRPLTPDEEEEDEDARPGKNQRLVVTAPQHPRERKKRQAAKKGWKGWVEGSPPPSEKLINLDSVPVLRERRLRSGKHFDGVGPGGSGK